MWYDIPVKINNSRANYSSKMSKLFGEVGRVDRRMLDQTYLCPLGWVENGKNNIFKKADSNYYGISYMF